jgi:tripartite-type tricarboxylate transporter receptor subunit TctC
VPKERIDILRKAFMQTMKDKEFIEECEKVRLPVDPVSGEELESAVLAAFKTPRPLVEKLKEVMYK